MNITDGPVGSRQFEANPPFWGSKVASMTTPAWQKNPFGSWLIMAVGVFAFSAVLGGLYMGLQSLSDGRNSSSFPSELVGRGFPFILAALLFGGVYFWTKRSHGRKIVVSLTNDGLTVSTRPGEVYPFHDAKLGTWGVTGSATMGVALHLQCGERTFVLGGRDRRVAAGTRLEAPDVGYGQSVDVDAWLPASEFDEILAAVSRRSGLDVRSPAPGDPTRCLLFTNSLKVQEIGSFSFRKQQQFMGSLSQPRLAIDVDSDGIRVVDPNSNALIASVSPAQVKATPVVFRPMQRHHWFPSLGNAISDAATDYWSKTPGMYVFIPGLAPLTIGCRDSNDLGLGFRFSWPDNVPTEEERADYEVSGTDWMTLVEKFGLAPYLVNRGGQGTAPA